MKDTFYWEGGITMEDKLDNVEEGKENWNSIVDDFFKPIKKSIEIAEKEVSKIEIEDVVSEEKCDKCGRNMVIKHGRFGDFLACPGYPDCKNTKPIVEQLEVPCPKCGGKKLAKRSKKGKKFYGCSNYPNCDFVSWFEPVSDRCPECNSIMVKKYTKTKGLLHECTNENCKNKIYKNDKE
jgi:DNA topoisomerase-1